MRHNPSVELHIPYSSLMSASATENIICQLECTPYHNLDRMFKILCYLHTSSRSALLLKGDRVGILQTKCRRATVIQRYSTKISLNEGMNSSQRSLLRRWLEFSLTPSNVRSICQLKYYCLPRMYFV
jgi:hypothetical protein